MLVPAGLDTDWLAFSDACIMQSRLRGGSHQFDPWKPRICSEAGSPVPWISTYAASPEERTDQAISGGVLHPTAHEVEMHPSCSSGAADQPTLA
jgi:hypothetical protein